jgi:hypothetical protein
LIHKKQALEQALVGADESAKAKASTRQAEMQLAALKKQEEMEKLNRKYDKKRGRGERRNPMSDKSISDKSDVDSEPARSDAAKKGKKHRDDAEVQEIQVKAEMSRGRHRRGGSGSSQASNSSSGGSDGGRWSGSDGGRKSGSLVPPPQSMGPPAPYYKPSKRSEDAAAGKSFIL